MNLVRRTEQTHWKSRRRAVEDVLDRVEACLSDRSPATVGRVVGAIGARGFGPIFLVLSLFVISPLGGIPTVATLSATIMALFAARMLAGRRDVWLPDVLARREVRSDAIGRATAWLRPGARMMDRWFGRRLIVLTSDAAQRAAALVIIALCVTVPPLEVVPFAALLPMSGIALFGLAITMRDGLVMLAAFTLAGCALIGAPMLLLSS